MDRSRSFNFVEALESRRLRSAVYPTPVEQYAVELINRARANPTAEAQRWTGYQDGSGNVFTGELNEGLPAGTISADAKQPVAVNPYLTDAARKHAQWIVDNSTFDHFESDGKTPGDRIAAAGYSFPSTAANSNWGENIAIDFSSGTLDPTVKALDQQRNLFTDQTENDPADLRGHRTNMLDPTRNEIGVGFVGGLYNLAGHGQVNSLASDQDTATNGTLFLTGVAYTDAVLRDSFYTVGEGLGGITVTATRKSDGQAFSTQTWASGGYSLPLPAGTYDVTGVGTGLTSTVAYNSVTIGTQNVKKDFVTGQSSDTPVVIPFSRIRSRTLILTGTPGNDVIGVYVSGGQYFAGMATNQVHYSVDLIDAVAVLAGNGNDRVVIGDGVLHDYVEGGYGKDTLIGGPGDDTLYGNASIDYINGNGGNDFIVGENGNDLIYGGTGNDRLYGGAGNDTVYGENGNDRIYGGVGNDLLYGGNGRDILNGEQGGDYLDGGRYTDTAYLDPLDTRIAIEVLV